MKTKCVSPAVRNPALDIVRLIALFCVVSIHFFKYTGFYSITVSGFRMYAAVLLRTGFLICVPLFIVLSGYLLKNKKPTHSYYRKLVKTVATYILASICCIAAKLSEVSSLRQLLVFLVQETAGILEYATAPYAWYVEMYIGLFLMIPYLNILYNNLEGQVARRRLILTFLFLTAIPSVINIYRFNPSWWLNPASTDDYYTILPHWWTELYPITYYFIGAYLRDYPPKLTRTRNTILIFLVFFLNGTFNFYRSQGDVFVSGTWQEYNSLPVLIQTVLVFILFTQRDYTWIPPKITNFLGLLSDLCFGAYLVSWIFDKLFYATAGLSNADPLCRLEYYILIVPAVYICSLLLSALINVVYNSTVRLLLKISRKKALS